MPLTVVLRALVVLVVFIQLSCCTSLPARNKRHVDGMFTSEYSRARGSAAIRKIINSALAGKRSDDQALNDTPQNQLCSAILNLLSRMSLQSPQLCNTQLILDVSIQKVGGGW
ncbi:PREDICTED: secretin [Nanorana parkeri]|uniref:secretin n=1 Tax=Nanorana parkeri TaxID=125878 RepID=UPI0008543D1A|nr:PREDICTED: secretin [Nanorana parkeri]